MSDNRLPVPNANDAVLDGKSFARTWFTWVSRVTKILQGGEPRRLKAYAVAELPPAEQFPNCDVIVTNDVGGRTVAFSDGTVWRRTTDLSEVTA